MDNISLSRVYKFVAIIVLFMTVLLCSMLYLQQSTPPQYVGMCDEECSRFRRLLDAWPAGKPKGAVVILLEGPLSISYYARSSRLFGANFNDAYNYPVIIFHEENLNNHTYRQQLRSLTNSSLYFQVSTL